MDKDLGKQKADFHKKYIKTKEFECVREAVLSRDGYKCVICGRTDNLVCHHTSYKHLGQHNLAEISDCVTLCQLDHINHHRGKYNIHWYSVEHPRNNDDLREVEYWGLKILVRSNGEDFFDAETYKKLKVYHNSNRGNRATVHISDKQIYTHRLVAKAFPEICGEWFDECEVHHKDQNPYNNKAENLQVLTAEEHVVIHKDLGFDKISIAKSEPVYQYTMSGNYVTRWESSIAAAEHLGIVSSGIRNVTCGISESAGGFIWKHFEEGEEIPLFVEPVMTAQEKTKLRCSIPISQYTKTGEWIADWSSITEATKALGGKSNSSINNVLKGRSHTALGFTWKYKY